MNALLDEITTYDPERDADAAALIGHLISVARAKGWREGYAKGEIVGDRNGYERGYNDMASEFSSGYEETM